MISLKVRIHKDMKEITISDIGKTLKVVLLHCLIKYLSAEKRIISQRVKQDLNFINVEPTISLLESPTVRSKVECISKCLTRKECGYMFYNTPTNLCNFYDSSRESNQFSFQNRIGWQVYYNKSRLCPVHHGYLFNSNINRCVKPFGIIKNHVDARSSCLNDFGNLARIDNFLMWQFVRNMLIHHSQYIENVYVQGKMDSFGVWKFEDGTHISYFNWGNSQPAGSEYLVLFAADNYLFHDVKGTFQYGFVCEIYLHL